MKQEDKAPFMKKMAAANVPLRVRFELTKRCNLRCIHCKVRVLDSPADELYASEISTALDSFRAAGAMEIGLTGGEVFSRPDVAGVLAAILEKDFFLHIQTNAAGISDEHIALLARHAARVNRVACSVYSPGPDIHDSITCVPGSHARTLENIFKMRDAGLKVHCFTLLMNRNASEAQAMKAFYEENNLPHQFNSFIIPREDGCSGPLDKRIPDELLGELPMDWFAYLNPGGPGDPDQYHACATLETICPAARFPVITATGDVIACSLLRESAGNVRDKDFSDIWNNSPVLERVRNIRLQDLECFSCELFPKCKPCIGLALLEHGDIHKKPTEMCRLSKIMIKEKDQRKGAKAQRREEEIKKKNETGEKR